VPAASLLDLIDEFRPSVVPAFSGGGTVYPRYQRVR